MFLPITTIKHHKKQFKGEKRNRNWKKKHFCSSSPPSDSTFCVQRNNSDWKAPSDLMKWKSKSQVINFQELVKSAVYVSKKYPVFFSCLVWLSLPVSLVFYDFLFFRISLLLFLLISLVMSACLSVCLSVSFVFVWMCVWLRDFRVYIFSCIYVTICDVNVY